MLLCIIDDMQWFESQKNTPRFVFMVWGDYTIKGIELGTQGVKVKDINQHMFEVKWCHLSPKETQVLSG